MKNSDTERMAVDLKNNVAQYVQFKSELDPLEKKCKSLNTNIKQLMELLKVEEVPLPNGSGVRYSVSKRESLDEEKLIKQLKQFAPDTQCIKTKEYIDMDILENEIYHGKLSDDAMCAMDSCRSTKLIPKLDIIKKGKK